MILYRRQSLASFFGVLGWEGQQALADLDNCYPNFWWPYGEQISDCSPVVFCPFLCEETR